MNQINRFLLSLLALVWVAAVPASAQDKAANSLDSIAVVKQGGLLNVKMVFREPLASLPAGFSVANPARIALDLPGMVNGLGKNYQVFNEVHRALPGKAALIFRKK